MPNVTGVPDLDLTKSEPNARAILAVPVTGMVEVDLTNEKPGDLSPHYQLQAWSPDKARESYRGWIAGWLIAVLAFIVIFSLVSLVAWQSKLADVKSLLEILLPVVVTLVGTVVGFYFGVKQTPDGSATVPSGQTTVK
jgi:hypothetical protein